jgi:hypothetical protein
MRQPPDQRPYVADRAARSNQQSGGQPHFSGSSMV